ncbi:type III-B CRISPR module RAMP protein Cmr1 [Thermus antranikianii]
MRRVKEWSEAYAPRLREEGGVRYRYDGVPLVRVERTYRLLTPLFGGGVEPRLADPVTVVRGTEVRGQLRFWWRAVRGWQAEGDLKRLFDLEAAIFGSAGEGGASPVAVEVEVLEPGADEFPYVVTEVYNKQKQRREKKVKPRNEVAHSYLTFPLRPEGKQPIPIPLRTGVRFRLTVTFPTTVRTANGHLDLHKELEAALWAWETFGGIGARTRRGFGALTLEGSKVPTEAEIRERLRRYSRDSGWPDGVPHLTPQSLFRVVNLSWRKVAEEYQAFRQARTQGRGSEWPEPKAIRHLYGYRKAEKGSLPSHTGPKSPGSVLIRFPRGQFGLPIVFQFRGGNPLPTTILRPVDGDRLASPLIFRPLDAKVCLLAVLEGPRMPPKGVLLVKKKENGEEEVLAPEQGEPPLEVCLSAKEAAGIAVLNGKEDPLRAFVEYLPGGEEE